MHLCMTHSPNCSVVEYHSLFLVAEPVDEFAAPPTIFISRIPNDDASPGPPLFPGLPLGFLPYGPHHLPLHLHGRQTRATEHTRGGRSYGGLEVLAFDKMVAARSCWTPWNYCGPLAAYVWWSDFYFYLGTCVCVTI